VAQKDRYKESQKEKKSFDAKRRIQGCYISGSKEKWGCFLIKKIIVHYLPTIKLTIFKKIVLETLNLANKKPKTLKIKQNSGRGLQN